ncbi:MAG: SDR family oxidoreductase [Brumimicrobium sp.]|nr:SDR family oxidoreductase [Brumimicrobium sp.]
MRILITGSNGLLGQKIVDYCKEAEYEYLASSYGHNRNPYCPDRNFITLDVSERDAVQNVCKVFEPTHIINTAALTNVDLCEEKKELCERINVKGVENLLDYCIQNNTHLQQLSTDFIFDGKKGNYAENDEPNPLSEYGKSKWKAEQIISSSSHQNFSIVRTSVVYGTGHSLSKSNIVVWAIDSLRKGEELKIVNDQFRSPAFADDLAKGCMRIIELNAKGVFNICGPCERSIYDYVLEIAQHLGISENRVIPIDTKTLNQKAIRPKRSGLNIEKAKNILNFSPRSFGSTLFLIEDRI